jgi:hypothetical protein
MKHDTVRGGSLIQRPFKNRVQRLQQVTAVPSNCAMFLRMALLASKCMEFDRALSNRGMSLKLAHKLAHINHTLRHEVKRIGCEMKPNKHRRHRLRHLRE